MVSNKVFAIIALLCVSAALSVEIPNEDGVLVLGQDNFAEAIQMHKFLLVEFYAPWCGHCKKLTPEFIKAAEILARENPPQYLAKVDATQHGDLAKKFDVSGYPTLKFFVDGVPQEYNGGRTEPEIVSWLRKKTGPPSREFNTHADVEAWTNSSDVAVVFFGNNDALFTIFENVARNTEDISFAHCKSAECLTHFAAKDGQVTLFKKFDNLKDNLMEFVEAQTLTNFINSNSTPLVMKFDEKCAQVIFGKATPGIFFYRDANAENAAMYQELAMKIAKELNVNYFF